MKQPQGYVVCKLKKAICGLKQSLRTSFDKFSRVIGAVGFWRYYSDHFVFIWRGSSRRVVSVGVGCPKLMTFC